MTVDEKLIQQIAALVAEEIKARPVVPKIEPDTTVGLGSSTAAESSGGAQTTAAGALGIFTDVDEAVEAAWLAQKELQKLSLSERQRLTDSIIETLSQYIEELSRMELSETGMGNYEDKLTKHRVALYRTSSVEDLKPEMATGDDGVALYEFAPFGVIGALTPSTNPSETVINNSIIMIAAGNSVVFSTHPGAYVTSNRAVELVNEAISKAGGPANLVVSIDKPGLAKTDQLLHHPKVTMLCATGGPGVVKAVLSTGKKAIGAGAGNPPALVDETADVAAAAKDIVDGCSYDYNIPCVAEKAVVAVDTVADDLIGHMQEHGAYLLKNPKLIDALTALLMPAEDSPNKAFIGKSPAHIMRQFGVSLAPAVRVVIFEAPGDHPLVLNEQMMPVLPIVRVPDARAGIDLCCRIENGRRHTATCHSTNMEVVTEMAKRIQTTVFVNNGPSFAGIGVGGVGYTALTIAGPTGEGLTSPSTFTRKRKCALVNSLNIR